MQKEVHITKLLSQNIFIMNTEWEKNSYKLLRTKKKKSKIKQGKKKTIGCGIQYRVMNHGYCFFSSGNSHGGEFVFLYILSFGAV